MDLGLDFEEGEVGGGLRVVDWVGCTCMCVEWSARIVSPTHDKIHQLNLVGGGGGVHERAHGWGQGRGLLRFHYARNPPERRTRLHLHSNPYPPPPCPSGGCTHYRNCGILGWRLTRGGGEATTPAD